MPDEKSPAAPETQDDQPGQSIVRRTPAENWLSERGVDVLYLDDGSRQIRFNPAITQRANLLVPLSSVTQLSRNWTPVPRLVMLTPDEDTYKQGWDPKAKQELHALRATGLRKIADVMGIEHVNTQWNRPPDTDNGIRATVTARMRGPDGLWRYSTKTKTIRFEEHQEKLKLDAVAKRERDNEFRERDGKSPLPDLTETELRKLVLEDMEHVDAKALADDAPVLTPHGNVRMGDLQVGDLVIGSDGAPTPVLAVWPQGERELYRVTFADGVTVDCTEDHRWPVAYSWAQRRHGAVLVPLSDMVGRKTVHVPCITAPVQYAPRPEPLIDPWLVGALLGDGSFDAKMVRFTTADAEMAERVAAVLPPDAELVKDTEYAWRIRTRRDRSPVLADDSPHRAVDGRCSWAGRLQHRREYGSEVAALAIEAAERLGSTRRAAIAVGVSRSYVNKQMKLHGRTRRRGQPSHALLEWIRTSGLSGKRAWEKYIPEDLLLGSPATRLAVLQGLMDTDGSVHGQTGSASLCTTSAILATQVQQLVLSLGGYSIVSPQKSPGRPAFHISVRIPGVTPLRLSRKVELYENAIDRRGAEFPWRRVKSIERVGRGSATCITVAAADQQFLVAGSVRTGNCETKAYNRTIRDLAKIATIPKNRLELPFVTLTFYLTPDPLDPHAMEVVRLQYEGAVGALYEGVTPDQADHHEALPQGAPLPDGSLLGTVPDDEDDGLDEDEGPIEGHEVALPGMDEPIDSTATDVDDEDWGDEDDVPPGDDDLPEPDEGFTPERGPYAGKHVREFVRTEEGYKWLEERVKKMRSPDKREQGKRWMEWAQEVEGS